MGKRFQQAFSCSACGRKVSSEGFLDAMGRCIRCQLGIKNKEAPA